MNKFENLNLLLSEDINDLLSSINKYEKLINGEIFCEICNISITKQNLQMIIPIGSNYKFICNNLTCIENYFEDKNDDN